MGFLLQASDTSGIPTGAPKAPTQREQGKAGERDMATAYDPTRPARPQRIRLGVQKWSGAYGRQGPPASPDPGPVEVAVAREAPAMTNRNRRMKAKVRLPTFSWDERS